MADYDLGPLPHHITGGCLCGKIAWRVVFPEGHDFKANVRDRSYNIQTFR